MIIFKKILFILVVYLMGSMSTNAADAVNAKTNYQTDIQNLRSLLQTTINQLTQINYSSPIIVRQLVYEDLLPLFDFDYIGKHITQVIPFNIINR